MATEDSMLGFPVPLLPGHTARSGEEPGGVLGVSSMEETRPEPAFCGNKSLLDHYFPFAAWA